MRSARGIFQWHISALLMHLYKNEQHFTLPEFGGGVTVIDEDTHSGVQISRYIANFGDRDIYLVIDATDSGDCPMDRNTVHAQNSSVDYINSVQESTGDPRSTTFLVR